MIPTAGLYVHIPFCETRCAYCNFYSLTHLPIPEHQYREALIRHLGRFRGVGNVRFDSLYAGGGTPSRMPAFFFKGLLADLKKHVTLAEAMEYTVEVNPEHADPSYLDGLVDAGVNRVSLGVQSLDDAVLKRMGRIHNANTALNAIHSAAQRFEQVSIDFILGVKGGGGRPEQLIPEDVCGNVHHISVYMLEGARATPLKDEDDRVTEEYLALCQYLESQGFIQYEISNFSRNGCQCRHNLHYWNGDPYIGLGPSAHSLWAGQRIGAGADLNAFLSTEIQEEIDECPPSVLLREVMMLRLRTREGARRGWFQKRFGVDIFKAFQGLHQRFPGLVIQEAGGYRLSRSGMLLSNEIFEYVLLNEDGSEV